MKPYKFDQPPLVHAHGTIPLRREEDADLYFQVEGGPFHWNKFNVRQIAGNIHWAGLHLDLSGVDGEFYGGQATGWASFDFKPKHDPDYRFSLTTTNTQLHSLMADLSARTNHLDGLLSGTLNIAKANSADWRNTEGNGAIELRDGLLWDIPVFGIFSDVLNGITPGLGSSRASAAACNFTITNGVIRSDDLELRSPAMRLQYDGTVDLQGHVDARVEASLLRDMPLFGPLVSTVLWPMEKLFEYKVSGNLREPKIEPLFFIPRIVLLPFHPFRTLKSLMADETNLSSTNAPSTSQGQ
jgi:hypothetical protein